MYPKWAFRFGELRSTRVHVIRPTNALETRCHVRSAEDPNWHSSSALVSNYIRTVKIFDLCRTGRGGSKDKGRGGSRGGVHGKGVLEK